MGENFSKVSEKVQNHLKQLAGSVQVAENGEESTDPLETLAGGWLEKEKSFESQVTDNDMEILDSFSAEDESACLILTYSGSLLSIGPLTDGGRKVEYNSVGIRTDVPAALSKDDAQLNADIWNDEPVEFVDGPLQKSSPVYKIAVVKQELSTEEAEEQLANVTQMIMEDFLRYAGCVL